MRCDECVAELKNVSAGPGSEESELRSLLHKQTDVRGVIDIQEMRWKWEIYSRNLQKEQRKPLNRSIISRIFHYVAPSTAIWRSKRVSQENNKVSVSRSIFPVLGNSLSLEVRDYSTCKR